MKWIVRLVAFLIAVVLVVLTLGYALPVQSEHTRSITLKQPPEAVFTALADVQKMPEWNRNLSRVEILPPTDGKETMRQTLKNGMSMELVTTESLSPTHLVRESKGGPYVGSWTYEIAPTNDGSKVTLTEKAEIKKPPLRVLARVFGPTKYLDEHLIDLARHFGEQARPR